MDLKMPIYETMTFLFTGVFLCVGVGFICPEILRFFAEQEIVHCVSHFPTGVLSFIVLVLFYEIGRLLNYIAQLLEHNLLCRLIHKKYDVNYAKYNLAQQKFPKIEILSRERTVARLHIVIFLIYALLWVFTHRRHFYIVLLPLALVFISLNSYGRFVEHISALVASKEENGYN